MRSKQWMLLAPLAMVATVAVAAPAWVSTTAYTGGTTVTYAGQDWRAKWWTQGDVPGAAQWGPWEVVAGTTPTPTVTLTPTPNVTLTPTPRVTPTPTPGVTFWQASQAYTAGQVVCYGSSRFEAKWWVQGEVPDPTNTWGPWKVISPCEILPTPPVTATPKPTATPTPSPTPSPTPPVTGIPNPLPTGSPIAINWTLAATGTNSANVSWSVDSAQLAGVAPANWHVVFAGVIPVLDSTSIWVGDDFINNKATYGGSGSIAGKMIVANLAYKLLVCNAAYTKCVESISVQSFTGQVPVTRPQTGYTNTAASADPQRSESGNLAQWCNRRVLDGA